MIVKSARVTAAPRPEYSKGRGQGLSRGQSVLTARPELRPAARVGSKAAARVTTLAPVYRTPAARVLRLLLVVHCDHPVTHAACKSCRHATESLIQNVARTPALRSLLALAITRSTPHRRRRHPAPVSSAATHATTHAAAHTQPIFAPHLELWPVALGHVHTKPLLTPAHYPHPFAALCVWSTVGLYASAGPLDVCPWPSCPHETVMPAIRDARAPSAHTVHAPRRHLATQLAALTSAHITATPRGRTRAPGAPSAPRPRRPSDRRLIIPSLRRHDPNLRRQASPRRNPSLR